MATKKPAKKAKATAAAKAKTAKAVKPTTKNAKAAQKTAKRQVKPATIREKAVQTANQKPKTRKVRRAAQVAVAPLSVFGRFVARLLKPFSFVLIPFKTRPARAIGRFLAAVLLLKYFRDSWKELKLVEWPNARQTLQLTIAVFVFAIFFSAIISLVDFGLDKAFQKLIIK